MDQVLTLYRSSLGKKIVVAVTGFIGVIFVIGHMLGNLQVFMGSAKINQYSVFLRSTGGLLWVVRFILLTAVILHITASYQLTKMSLASRPIGYQRWHPVGSDVASRTMRWSGPILLVFIVYHLLHFTSGTVHPDFRPGDVYRNMVTGFQVWPVAAFYVGAMVVLGFHLYHGVWSMFQTLGMNRSNHNRLVRRAALFTTLVVVIGFIAIPAAVLLGFLS